MIRRTPLFLGSLHAALRTSLLAVATLALAGATAHAQTAAAPTTSKNAAAAAPESPYHGEVVEDIVARVNDQVIGSSDYAHAEQEMEGQAKQRNWTAAELDEQKKQLLRDLIDNQLLLSKGKQLGITGEAETIRQLDELRKQNNLDSMEALEKAAEQQGVAFADFKAGIQNRVITSQVIRDEVGRRINITQADEQAYYDQHKDQFTTPEQVKLSEILVPTADPDNAAEVAKAQTQADELAAQLKAGKDFAAVAKASSGGSTAAQGGVLGDFKRGQLAKVLEDATFSLKPGEYTAPIRTKQGFVLLKVDEHMAAGQQPFTAVQPQVEEAVGMQKMNPALRQYLTRLREEASIQVKPGFVDASASSNETQPIFSAYQPPQPKKKKKQVDRTRFSGRGRTRDTVHVARTSAPATPVAAAAPAGVPSLADVPSGTSVASTASAADAANPVDTTAASTTTAGATSGNIVNQSTGTAANASPSKATQTASARTLKPGKREKVRFGQAPRETLPAADTHAQDAGASTDNGNASTAETALAQNTAPSGLAPGATGNVNGNMRYGNGESATEEQAATKKVKSRFSDRVETKAVKAEKKRLAKVDPYPAAPPDAQEIADKSVQANPLGLAGDTSVKAPKPKPTSKTRYSDEAGRKADQPGATAGTDANGSAGNVNGASTSSADNAGSAPDAGTSAPAAQQPGVTTQPYKEPSPQNAPGTDAPVQTQTTPTGSGDPMGSPSQSPQH